MKQTQKHEKELRRAGTGRFLRLYVTYSAGGKKRCAHILLDRKEIVSSPEIKSASFYLKQSDSCISDIATQLKKEGVILTRKGRLQMTAETLGLLFKMDSSRKEKAVQLEIGYPFSRYHYDEE